MLRRILVASTLCLFPVAGPALAAPPLTADPSWIFDNGRGGSWFGYSVASAGDVNGDGYDDVIVGAPFDGASGAAFVFLGSATGLNAAAWQWMSAGEGSGSRFGWSVAGAGDVNGDGYDDVIVGAPMWNSGEGRAYVYFGSAGGLATTPSWSTTTGGFYYFWATGPKRGSRSPGAGDVNGDGYGDIVVGARSFYRAANVSSGGVFLWLGASGGLGPNGTPDNADWRGFGQQGGDQLGFSVAAAGDVNGDGRSDLVVGAPGYGDPDAGRVYVFRSAPSGLLYPPSAPASDLDMNFCALPVTSPSLRRPGFAVCGAGDLDADGTADVAIGLPWSTDPVPQVTVWLGPGNGTLPYAWTAGGDATIAAPAEEALGRFGAAVAGTGDVDGDGRDDLAVSDARPTAPITLVDAERVFLFRGGAAGIETSPAWSSPLLTEEAFQFDFYYVPRVIGGAGDTDGDGFPDLVVGLPGYHALTPPRWGRTHLWRGGAQPLAVEKHGNGSGTVSSSPAGIACGSDCSELYNHRTVVTLTEVPDSSSLFGGWSGACSGGATTCIVSMDDPKTAVATFTLRTYPLSVTKTGTGSGSVTSTPPGIDCGADCAETYDHGTSVTLAALPAAGSVFRGWTGDGDCADGRVLMTAAHACDARFDILLTVAKTGTGAGRVTSAPAGIDCGDDCEEAYALGAEVALSATPDEGSRFSGWSGDADCLDGALTMSASRTCVAAFQQGTGWIARDNTTAAGDDTPMDIGVDGSGNVFVVSTRCPAKNQFYNCLNQDIVTTRYDSAGTRVWYDIYEGPALGQDYSRALTVDTQGNVIVTGSSEGAVGNYDVVTIKYSATGQRLWVLRYDGAAHTGDFATDVEVDGSGNIYVACESVATTSYDFTTRKYSAAGDFLWEARYNGPLGASSSDRTHALAVDSLGRARICGDSTTTDNMQRARGDVNDFATVGYAAGGSEEWSARYDGPSMNLTDSCRDIAVDPFGYVAVTGTSGNGSATVRYTPLGQQSWVMTHPTLRAVALASDPSGDFFVGGTDTTNAGDYKVIRYTAAGALSWEVGYDGPGHGYDEARALARAPDGSVYVTGGSPGTTSTDFATVQYDAAGLLLWEARYNGPAGLQDGGRVVVVGPDGNVYVTGTSCVELDASNACKRSDAVTIKYSRCLDADADGLCDLVDPDDDGDGVEDGADCAPLDRTSWTPPSEVADLALSGSVATTVSWTCAGSGVHYDIAGGLVSALRHDGGMGAAECLVSGAVMCAIEDTRPAPAAGESYYYIVRAANACLGSYGFATNGTERRPTADCP